MTIQNENNSSELIDIKAETAKNEAAIAGMLKDNPGMSSFFGGAGGGATAADTEYGGTSAPAATRQSSEVEHFMTAGISVGGKKTEMIKQGMEILFDGGSKGTSMFVGGKKGGSFNIAYAGEKGAVKGGPAKQQSTPLVDPGYFAKRQQAKKGGSAVDKNHVIAANVTAAGNAVSGEAYGHHGRSYTSPSVAHAVTPEMVRVVSHTCHMLLQDKNTLYQMQNGPMSRNRLIQDLQDGKAGAEEQMRTMSAGQKVETFRNMSPSVKKDIMDGPGT